MTQWSERLHERSFSSALLDDVAPCCPETLLTSLRALRIEERADLTRMRGLLSSLQRAVSPELWRALSDEAEELVADNRFFGSKRGAYVAAINDWVQGFYAELRADADWARVVVGGHARKYVVVVSGVVPDAACAERLRTFLTAQRPPHPVLWDVHVGSYRAR